MKDCCILLEQRAEAFREQCNVVFNQGPIDWIEVANDLHVFVKFWIVVRGKWIQRKYTVVLDGDRKSIVDEVEYDHTFFEV